MHGTDRPGKTEFPPGWDEDKIIDSVEGVAASPDSYEQDPLDGTWTVRGVRDHVIIVVHMRPSGEIKTGYPEDGPGVRRNPRR